MDQLVLDLSPTPLPAFDNFLAERNKEVINALTATPVEPFIYLWGEAGCGKSHLLKAWIAHAEQLGKASIYLNAQTDHLPDFAREASYIAVDHIDDLIPDDQITLFSIYNSLKENRQGQLLMAGRVPPYALNIRDDLRTRIAWGLVLEVKALSEKDKLAAMKRYASTKQLAIPSDVFTYLLTHWRRDLSSLINIINLLDQYSLALQRPITVSLVKNILQTTRNDS